VVPNSVLAANAITNYSVIPSRRLELAWKRPLDADIEQSSAFLLDLARSNPRVSADPAPAVAVSAVADDSFELKLIYYVPTAAWSEIQAEMRHDFLTRIQARDRNPEDKTWPKSQSDAGSTSKNSTSATT
jgi:small-conductance mechanosensitive channel